jgi:hypothetical protein
MGTKGGGNLAPQLSLDIQYTASGAPDLVKNPQFRPENYSSVRPEIILPDLADLPVPLLLGTESR